MVFGMWAGLRNYGWLLVIAGTIGVYVWAPLWPHAVGRLPWLPWVPAFLIALILAAFYMRSRLTIISVVLGTAIVSMFFCLEGEVTLYLEVTRTHLFAHSNAPLSDMLTGIFAVPFIYFMFHLPVVVTFAALGLVIAMLARLSRPVPVGQ